MPRILPDLESKRLFDTPSVLPMLRLLPEAAHGKTPFSNSIPASLSSFSVLPVHATSGSV